MLPESKMVRLMVRCWFPTRTPTYTQAAKAQAPACWLLQGECIQSSSHGTCHMLLSIDAPMHGVGLRYQVTGQQWSQQQMHAQKCAHELGQKRTEWMRPMIFCSPTPLAMPWKRWSMRCTRLHLPSARSSEACTQLGWHSS